MHVRVSRFHRAFDEGEKCVTEKVADDLRDEAAGHTDAQITSVERYELSLRVGP